MEIGQRIRQLRQERELTLADLAATTGIDSGNLSRIERGRQGWTQDSLVRISDALGVRISELFVGDDLVKVGEVSEPGRLVEVSRELQKTGLDGSYALLPIASDREGIVIKHATFDAAAYGMVIQGDSLSPRYKAGEFCIVEPHSRARPGVDCLIELTNGLSLVREFYRKRADECEFVDVKTGHRMTIPSKEIKSIAPIVGHYPKGSGVRVLGAEAKPNTT